MLGYSINPDLVLRDVLYVPDFCFNLLSVSALTHKTSRMVHFTADSCAIQDKLLLKTIGKGDFSKGLYILAREQPLGV